MSRKKRGHRQKKKRVLSQVIYYLVIVALVAGIIGIIVVNRQQRAKRAEYKQTLISQETEVDISDLGDMMVRPSAETETETETETLAIALISWYDRDDKKDCMQKIVTEKDKGDWKNV